jgi:CRP/FNR family cyclic AMP-dependent transcriptional regulator
MGAKEIQLKPQEVLFEEGDQSKNLYYVKKGVIRIFKRKAEGNIEIDTIRTGQMLGELSFLDSQPRSASAEAITTTELIEISKSALDDALAKLPDWFVALTKTISSRLRNANNKIRALETLSTEYETDKHGNRSKEYIFVNTNELLRFSTALLAVASRYGKNATTDGIEFSSDLLERFSTQILQLASAKAVSLIELFKSVEVLKGDLFLTDIKFLDQFIQFITDQNLVESHKKRTLTERGFSVLSLIVQNMGQAQPGKDANKRKLNIAPALNAASISVSFAQELYIQEFVDSILIDSANDITVEFDPAKCIFEYRTFWLLTELEKLNQQKRSK